MLASVTQALQSVFETSGLQRASPFDRSAFKPTEAFPKPVGGARIWRESMSLFKLVSYGPLSMNFSEPVQKWKRGSTPTALLRRSKKDSRHRKEANLEKGILVMADGKGNAAFIEP